MSLFDWSSNQGRLNDLLTQEQAKSMVKVMGLDIKPEGGSHE